jgi:hypothetical protein
MIFLKGLEKSKNFWLTTLAVLIFFVLRFPSLFEPLWYGDEGIYQVIGNSLNHGKLLYSQVFDNKPPFLYWTYAILQSDQFSVRFTSLMFGIFAVIIFFLLSKKLFSGNKNTYIPFLTTFIFAILFGLPTLEGNIANAENFMLLPIILSAFLIVNQKKLFTAGLLLGVAFLFKIVAVFDLSAFLIFYLILNFDSLKKRIKISKILSGFFIPIILVTLYFMLNGAFIDFAKATLVNNISYVGYGNKIGSLPILLFIKLILLVIFSMFIFVKKKSINNSALFILIWFAFSLFNAFFSQRPYTHYLLVLTPSLSLMIGLILFENKYQKQIALLFIIGIFLTTKIFGIPNFGKSINYYRNYISYATGRKTTTSYQAFFDRNTPFDYEIARYIRPKLGTSDTIFVWGNNAQLYQLVGVVAPTKYVVAYHITNYKDGPTTTREEIITSKPKFIIIMTSSDTIPFSLEGYPKKIFIDNATIYGL